MKIADRVREIYERRPYPFGNAKALRGRTWALGLEWVDAIGRTGTPRTVPARVLVAGCGDGTEAFNLRRRLPDSKIVAVDFSPRSIALAKRLQRRARDTRDIRFVRADLTDPRLPARLGGGFDLVICHGVFSYIPGAGRAMKNFARFLKPDGVLYLGVNGTRHLSTRLRKALPEFGFDINEFRESGRMRQVLRLCDTVVSADGGPRVARHGPQYLAGDVFGVLNRCLSLADCAALARRAGLHFRGNHTMIRLFRRIAENDLHHLLIPRSRAQVAEFLELLGPSQFHRLLFSRTPEANPPWGSQSQLLKWRIAPTRLYKFKLPRPAKVITDRVRRFTIESRSLNLSMEWHMPEWEIELMRRGDGGESMGSVLRQIPLSVPFAEVRRQLYLLQHLGIINLLPPGAGG